MQLRLRPRNKVGAQLHDSLGPASNLQKIYCAHIGNYITHDSLGPASNLQKIFCAHIGNYTPYIYHKSLHVPTPPLAKKKACNHPIRREAHSEVQISPLPFPSLLSLNGLIVIALAVGVSSSTAR